jgi:hypothetical protein
MRCHRPSQLNWSDHAHLRHRPVHGEGRRRDCEAIDPSQTFPNSGSCDHEVWRNMLTRAVFGLALAAVSVSGPARGATDRNHRARAARCKLVS